MEDKNRLLSEKEQPKTAWDPEKSGYGKHEYKHIDPEEVNPEEYAKTMRGEEQHYGDVREYNTALNSKHPDNDATLDWLSRIGTVFTTEAEGYAGQWEVAYLPAVHDSKVYVVVRNDSDGTVEIPAVELGIVSDQKTGLFQQVVTKLIRRGKLSRTQLQDFGRTA